MENDELKQKKNKILNKIFISSNEHIKQLQNEIVVLKKENVLLKSVKTKRVNKILNEIGTIMRRYESTLDVNNEMSGEITKHFTEFWTKLSKELPLILNPKVKELLELKRNYEDEIKKQEHILKQLKKQKKKEIKETRKKIMA